VVRWHRRGFAAYWRWTSRSPGGRPPTAKEVRDLIRRMSLENPLWGATKIHGELLKLGIAGTPLIRALEHPGAAPGRPEIMRCHDYNSCSSIKATTEPPRGQRCLLHR
jgi:hypothetical protein